MHTSKVHEICTYMSLGDNEMNSPDTRKMNALITDEINVFNEDKVKALSLLWVLSHTPCISNLMLLLN